MFKKIISVLLCILIAISMVACNNNTNSDPTTNPSTPQSSDPTAPTQLIEIDKPIFSEDNKEKEPAIYEKENMSLHDGSAFCHLYKTITNIGLANDFGHYVICNNIVHLIAVDDNNVIDIVSFEIDNSYTDIIRFNNNALVLAYGETTKIYCCDTVDTDKKTIEVFDLTFDISPKDIIECKYLKNDDLLAVIYKANNAVLYREYNMNNRELLTECDVVIKAIDETLIKPNDLWVIEPYRKMVAKIDNRLCFLSSDSTRKENGKYIVDALMTPDIDNIESYITTEYGVTLTTKINDDAHIHFQSVLVEESIRPNDSKIKLPSNYKTSDLKHVYTNQFNTVVIFNDNHAFSISGSDMLNGSNNSWKQIVENDNIDNLINVIIESDTILVLMDDGKIYKYY